MARKYGLAAAAAFLLAAQTAHAPLKRFFPPKERVITESILDRYIQDSKEKFELALEGYKQRMDDLRNYRTSDFNLDSDELLMARLVFGEAEGCSKLEKIKIAWTALNRVDGGYGKTLKEVILSPYQYSCFNPEMDSSKFLKYPLEHNASEFMASLEIAKDVLAGKYPDPTGGAVSYYNPYLVKEPYWARTMKRVKRDKGDYHLFFRN
jgi:N-acetylmuramoyl-L-alanine amidase